MRTLTSWFSDAFVADDAAPGAGTAGSSKWLPKVPSAARMRSVLRDGRGHRREVTMAYVALCRGMRIAARLVAALEPIAVKKRAGSSASSAAAHVPSSCQGCIDSSLWVEVWCAGGGSGSAAARSEGRWVCIDPVRDEIDRPSRREILRAATQSTAAAAAAAVVSAAVDAVRGGRNKKSRPRPSSFREPKRCRVGFVVGISESGAGLRLVDVTRRYASSWAKSLAMRRPTLNWAQLLSTVEAATAVTPPLVVASSSSSSSPSSAASSDVIDLTSSSVPPPSQQRAAARDPAHLRVSAERERALWQRRRIAEEEALRRATRREKLPETASAYRSHPTYCMRRTLRQTEGLIPSALSEGRTFKGDEVFLREDVRPLRSERQWHREGRTVREEERDTPARVIPSKKSSASASAGASSGAAAVAAPAVADGKADAIEEEAAEEAAAAGAASVDATLSPYEQARAKKLLRNARKLASLGIASAAESGMLTGASSSSSSSSSAAQPPRRKKARREAQPTESKAPPAAGDAAGGASGRAAASIETQRDTLADARALLYGEWQTDAYVPPRAVDGRVPMNEFGNVELWSRAHLPRGCVHFPKRQYPLMVAVLRVLKMNSAPAMVGFERKQGRTHPVHDGIIVCEEHAPALLAAHAQLVQQKIEAAAAKRQRKRLKRWERLVRGALMRQRLDRQASERHNVAAPSSARPSGGGGGGAAAAVAAAGAASVAAAEEDERRIGSEATAAAAAEAEAAAHGGASSPPPLSPAPSAAALEAALRSKGEARPALSGVLLGLDGLPMAIAGFDDEDSSSSSSSEEEEEEVR